VNCADIRRRLSAYLDEELTAAETVEVRSHLSSCPSCRAELEFLKMLSQASSRALDASQFNQALVEKSFQAIKGRSAIRRRSFAFGKLAYAAASVLAAVAILLLASHYINNTGRGVHEALAVNSGESVFVKRMNSSAWRNLDSGERLYGGDVIRNSSDGVASLETPKGSRLVLKQETSVQMNAGSHTANYELISGEVFAQVNKEPFRIVCDGASVTVGGTSFSVRKEDSRVLVSVLEGVVTFAAGGKEVKVTAGCQSEALAGNPPAEPVTIASKADLNWRLGPAAGSVINQPSMPHPASPAKPGAKPGMNLDQPLIRPDKDK